jgi:hypothetical protein
MSKYGNCQLCGEIIESGLSIEPFGNCCTKCVNEIKGDVMNKRLTPSEIIENNIKIYAENNIKNLDDLNAYTLKIRLENKENK